MAQRSSALASMSLFLGLFAALFFGVCLAEWQSVTVIDDFGREIIIPEEPLRIVSTAPSITETLFALGLGDRVVGVTSYCNYPPEVLERVGRGEIAVIGEFINPSLEKILELEPDLVLAHNLLTPEFVRKLEEAGVPVVVIKTAESIEEVYQDIELIGKACWAEEEAKGLIEELRSWINFWREKLSNVEDVEAVYLCSVNPFWVAGSGTYIHDIIEHVGGRNIFSDKEWWAPISEEELVERDPPHIIIPYAHGEELIYKAVMEMVERGLIHGEIHALDPDIVSRPGPRVATAFEELVKALHPEIWSRVFEIGRLIVPGRAAVGDLVTIYVEVENPGKVAGDKYVEVLVNGDRLNQSVRLEPGESRLLKFTFIVEREEDYLISVGNLSAMLRVFPTVEELAKESFEKYVRKFIEEEMEALRDEFNSLRMEFKNLSSETTSQLSKLSADLTKLDEEVKRLNTLTITSITLAVIALTLSATIIVKSGKKR